MELVLDPARCSVCRLTAGTPWPTPPAGGRLFSVTRTADELSVVCAEGDEPTGARVEPGWRMLHVVGPLPFALVGVVASLTAPLAAAEVAVFVLSTFDTDLVLVKDADVDRAIDVFRGAGHRVRADPA